MNNIFKIIALSLGFTIVTSFSANNRITKIKKSLNCLASIREKTKEKESIEKTLKIALESIKKKYSRLASIAETPKEKESLREGLKIYIKMYETAINEKWDAAKRIDHGWSHRGSAFSDDDLNQIITFLKQLDSEIILRPEKIQRSRKRKALDSFKSRQRSYSSGGNNPFYYFNGPFYYFNGPLDLINLIN